MRTEVLPVSSESPEPAAIARAAEALRRGGLVAFPTETVYGLGANALDTAAVARIFAAKGRPANNPLIVHIAHSEQLGAVADLGRLTAAARDAVDRLADRFWPGPLTLVLPKQATVPDVVTAGGPTVAVRVPAHPVALALIRAAGVPLAAPSANQSSQLSPTRAAHVLSGLGGRVDMVLDGGPTAGGLESTVLDLTASPPRLLRPGLISPAAIESLIGPVTRQAGAVATDATPLPAPGMLARHYAPRVPLECVADSRNRVEELARGGVRVGWVTFQEPGGLPADVVVRELPRDAAAYAARLYAVLHELDAAGVGRIVVEQPPDAEEWLAVRDRLRRAATA